MNDALETPPDLLSRALRYLKPKDAPKGARRKLRRMQQRQAIQESPRLDVAPDPSVKGFAPWTREELFDYAYGRRQRIISQRPRVERAGKREVQNFMRMQDQKLRERNAGTLATPRSTRPRTPIAKLSKNQRKALRRARRFA